MCELQAIPFGGSERCLNFNSGITGQTEELKWDFPEGKKLLLASAEGLNNAFRPWGLAAVPRAGAAVGIRLDRQSRRGLHSAAASPCLLSLTAQLWLHICLPRLALALALLALGTGPAHRRCFFARVLWPSVDRVTFQWLFRNLKCCIFS